MLSTMQDFPLTVGMIFRHGRAVFGDSEVVTFEGDVEPARVVRRGRRPGRPALGGAAPPRRRVRRPGRHLRVEHPGAPRGVLRDPVHGRRAPHAQHPAVPRAARLHREPRRGPHRHRRRHARARCSRSSRPSCRPSSTTSWWATPTPPRSRATAAQVLRYDELLAAEQPGIAYPEIDERAAAAMCYTSGTTGNPKGVVYSHRSTFLHSIGVLQAGVRSSFTDRDRVLPVVPMFHANAWGMPVRGVDGRRRPDHARIATSRREPLARLIEQERPTCAGAVPDDLDRPPPLRRGEPRRRPLVAEARARAAARRCRGAHRAVRGAIRRPHRAGLGHDGDEPARRGVVAAEGRRARHHRGDRLAARSRAHHRRRRAAHRRRRRRRAAVGRRGGRRGPGARAVDHRLVLPRPRPREVRRRLAPHRRHRERHAATATSRSPTARRTSSSRAASGSRRSSSRCC